MPKETLVFGWECHYQMPYELLDAVFQVIGSMLCVWGMNYEQEIRNPSLPFV